MLFYDKTLQYVLSTTAGESISDVSWPTCTRKATLGIITVGVGVTTSIVSCTLVEICVITDKLIQPHHFVRFYCARYCLIFKIINAKNSAYAKV